jgi:hypothetical protein
MHQFDLQFLSQDIEIQMYKPMVEPSGNVAVTKASVMGSTQVKWNANGERHGNLSTDRSRRAISGTNGGNRRTQSGSTKVSISKKAVLKIFLHGHRQLNWTPFCGSSFCL